MLDREKVSAILRKRFPSANSRDIAAAVNAIIGIGSPGSQPREALMMTLKNVLVAMDFGEAATSALAYGRELARRFNATLHVIHVVDDVAARLVTSSGLPYDVSRLQSDLDESELQRLNALITDEDRRDLHARAVQVTSVAPAREIVSYAADAQIDVIVLGTHGRGPVAHLLMGSVAERVVRTAPCPVLTVRHPEHEFLRPDALQTVAAG
jgi:nucleotide-binding universal stress UspA family protein